MWVPSQLKEAHIPIGNWVGLSWGWVGFSLSINQFGLGLGWLQFINQEEEEGRGAFFFLAILY